MKKDFSRASFFTASALTLLASACAPNGTDGTDSSSVSDVSSTESSLASAQNSLQTAREDAKACFDTFKTCMAADNADQAACRSALKDCLPDQPPMPGQCGNINPGDPLVPPPPAHGGDQGGEHGGRPGGGFGGGGHDCDGGVPPPPPPPSGDGDVTPPSGDGDATAAPQRPGQPGDRGPRPGEGGDGDQSGAPAGDGDGNVSITPIHGGHGRGDHDGDGPGCKRPELPGGGDLHGCRDQADSDVAKGGDASAAEDAHDACVVGKFGGLLEKLCAKADDLCSQANAPADACARIKTACDDLAANP